MTLLERLSEHWERMDGAAARKIDRILKERREAVDEIMRLREAASLAREALDGLMGDSDLPEDDSKEMKAMQALNAVLPEPV